MKTFRTLFLACAALLALALLSLPAPADDHDLRVGSSGTRISAARSGELMIMEKTVDFAVTAMDSADTAKLFTIPAGATVLNVSATIDDNTTAATTIDVGDSADADGYLDGVSNGTTAAIFNSYHAANLRSFATYILGEADVAASQSAAAWGTDTATDVGGTIKGYAVPYAGYISAITVYSNATCTSGTLQAWPTINGTASSVLSASLDSVTNTSKKTSTQAFGLDPVAAGDVIGAKVTTSSTWAPTTADVAVAVTVVQNTVASQSAYCNGKYYAAANYLTLLVNGACTNGKITFRMVCFQP